MVGDGAQKGTHSLVLTEETKKNNSLHTLQRMAHAIFDRFIGESSTEQVNLNGHQVKDIQMRLAKLDASVLQMEEQELAKPQATHEHVISRMPVNEVMYKPFPSSPSSTSPNEQLPHFSSPNVHNEAVPHLSYTITKYDSSLRRRGVLDRIRDQMDSIHIFVEAEFEIMALMVCFHTSLL